MEEQYGAYMNFARVYDLFMDNVPYEQWGDYIEEVLKADGIDQGLLLDLGCGTGKLTRIMAARGYDMIGIDNSMEMLEIARDAEKADGTILYLLQDMREFELYGTVRAIYCACDSINYITEEADLLQVFRLVNNYLDPNGLFLFDCNTPYKYEVLLEENIFAENRPEGSFIWENYFDPESRVNEYDLTLYIRREDGLFERFEETHIQRAYEREQLCRLIRQADMELVAVYDAYTGKAPEPESERLLFIAREHGKQGMGR